MSEPREGGGAPPGRVLVTDGEFKHTLGIVRALAARGHQVHLLARSGRAPAAHSRAVHAWSAAPPAGTPEFEARLLEVAGPLRPVALVPVGSGSMASADRLRDRLAASGISVALPPAASFATANDKAKTAALAREAGVATPGERLVAEVSAARDAAGALGLPMILKSAREEGRKALRYVRRIEDVESAFRDVRNLATAGVLAQEFVKGEGFGFSALYWNGHRVRHCMHRRVREWPPTGGTSACAESLPDAPALERAGTAVLDALQWHGVAMVEFKGSLTGELKLMEVNAKFWGSHDVALAAGVDFPGDLVALLEGRALPPQPPVKRVRFAWPLGGDLWHALAAPRDLPAVLADALSPGVAKSFRWSDPSPSLWELAQWLRSTPGAMREARELR
jgi:predicted ATP-grasp superfamily ATP-dependent carboligase